MNSVGRVARRGPFFKGKFDEKAAGARAGTGDGLFW